MDLTTQDIIKILPFDEGFKSGLLERFDDMDPDMRYQVEKVLWDLYDAIYTLKIQEKVESALDPNSPDQVKLDGDFYKRIEEEVDQEIVSDSTKRIEAVDLQATRDQLQNLMKKAE